MISATSAATSAVLDAAPTVTTPMITGTAQEGQTLTAAATAGQSDNPVSYAWYSSADGYTTAIGSGATYLVSEADEGNTIEVKATATNQQGLTATQTSAATATVTDPPLVAFNIIGTAQEGQTLFAVNSSVDADTTRTYQWTRDGTAISGATNGSYVVAEADEGHLLRVVVADTEPFGAGASTSAPTSTVTDITLAFTTAAAVTGTAQEGATLSALLGTLNDSDASVSGYQWQSSSDGGTTWTNIASATNSTYVAQETDESHLLRVVETATDSDGGPSTTSTSAPTAAVGDIALAFTAAAAISGTAQEGQVLSAVNGTLNDSDAAVTGYQWTRDNVNISGATGSTYTVTETDETHLLRVVETAIDSDGGPSTTSTSAPTAAVTDITLAFTTAASISGTAQEGQVLTAVAGTLNDTDATISSYQWYVDVFGVATAIPGATGATYVVKEAYEGFTIQVGETASDSDGGPSVTSLSSPTSVVSDITLAFTTAASISGTAQEGQVLTGVNGTLNDSDAAVTSYQWQSGATSGGTYSNITTNGTSSTYTPVEADEGRFLRVVETATDADGGPTTTSISAPTSAVTDITLAFTTAASITGTAQEGSVLTAVNGTLNDSDASVTGYQWQSSSNGGTNWTNITSATNSTYVAQEGDEGHLLRVVETATDSDGGPSTTSTSTATAAVGDIALAFTAAAAISGTAQEGSLLTAVNGTLNDSDAAVTGYQWTRDGVNISGATGSAYTVTEADESHLLRVVETATDSDGGPSTISTSAPTAAVTDITLAFTAPAAISGTAKEGSLLTAVNGTLNDSDAAVTGYQWTRDGVNISGATGSTYTVTEADESHLLRVVETATDSDGGPSTTSTSAPTAAASDIILAFTTAASISGTAKEGQVLTAVAGTLNDTDAAVTGYQWTRDGVNISGATGSTYTVTEADESHLLRVVETATDSDGGPSTTSTSAPTAAVAEVTPTVSITGTAQKNQTLTAVATTDADATLSYQWQTSSNNGSTWSNISGATGSTYAVKNGDVGKVLRVAVTYTDTDMPGSPLTVDSAQTATVISPAGITASPINLALGGLLVSPGALVVTVSGIPADWELNKGTQNADGSWTVQTSDPSLLTVTTPSKFAGATVLNVSESWTNADGSAGIAYVRDNVEAYPASPIFAVSGDDTLTGGTAGNNEFVFAQPIGNDTIYNFTTASDTIDLIGFGLPGFGALAIANDASGNAVITLGAGETITVKGVDASALLAANFVFDTEPVSTNKGMMNIGDGAILPLGGTVENTGVIAINSTGDESDLEIQVRGVTLEGGGQITLTDNSQNVIFGGDPSAVLDNVDNTISGAGQLGNGQLTLRNEGVIEATGASALVIDTGGNAIVNTGTLAAKGAGGLVVNSAVAGGGIAEISGSSKLEFSTASDAKVSFDTGATGTLKLDQAGAFTGTVAGFTGYDAIDLADLMGGGQATIGYAANADNSGGTLTVGDAARTHTFSLALLGQYAAASDFAVTSDGHGGTLVTLADPSQNHALTFANASH
jgi:hypothetical protein